MDIKLSPKHVISSAASTGAIAVAAYILMGQAPSPQNCYFVTMPPRRYDYLPAWDFTDMRIHHDAMDSTCRSHADFSYMRMRLQSCVITTGDRVLRIIPHDLGAVYTACLIEHENGHINGWGAGHEGSRRHAAPAEPGNSYAGF